MIVYLSSIIVDLLIHNEIIKKEQASVYQYGFEIFISSIITGIITIACGLILSCLPVALLYFGIFVILRMICGGYHARTYWQCNLIFAIVTIITLLTFRFVTLEQFSKLHICSIGFSILVTAFYAPVENENKPLSPEQKKFYRILGTILILMLATLSCVLKIKLGSNYSILIDVTMSIVALFMFVTEPTRGVNKNVQNDEESCA